MNIRGYCADDYDKLSTMIMSLYSEDSEGEPMNQDKINTTIRVLSDNPYKGAINIIESDSNTVGYAILVYQWSNEYGCDYIHIDELYIEKQMRKQGIWYKVYLHHHKRK